MLSSYFHDELIFLCEPDKMAKNVVDGILKNLDNIHASRMEALFASVLYFLPRKIKTCMMRSMVKGEKRDEYIKMRLKNCKLID